MGARGWHYTQRSSLDPGILAGVLSVFFSAVSPATKTVSAQSSQ